MHNVHVSKIRRVSAQARAVDTYLPAEGSPLADVAAFFRFVLRDVVRALQIIPEGMRRAVMLAAMTTNDYDGMAVRLKINLGTFKSRLSRRRHLRTKFTERGGLICFVE
jgi:DNA-directed RNA polymerase specialized sigma24 family protein